MRLLSRLQKQGPLPPIDLMKYLRELEAREGPDAA
jgi:hypothetical protein